MPGFEHDHRFEAVVQTLRAAGCVFAEDEAQLLVEETTTATELDDLVSRRASGIPLEQILGWARFCGMRISVEPQVFVPRRRSEFLVNQAVAEIRPGPLVVDLCCGTGAVGAAIALQVRDVDLHAADLDPAAVRCAQRNLAGIGLVHQGDLYEALPGSIRARVDLITANAPYVPSDAIAYMPPEARLHEPRHALDGGADGVDLHRRLATEAHHWLRPGGRLLIETSERQSDLTAAAMAAAGLLATVAHDDDLDATVVTGRFS